MKILVTGGTGFIGQHLIPALIQDGHEVTLVSRSLEKAEKTFGDKLPKITWDQLEEIDPSQFNAAINLAGQNIGDRYWTASVKEEILNSRLKTTEKLVQWCNQTDQSFYLYNASAIGIYGLQQSPNDHSLPPKITESDEIKWGQPSDFLSEVGQAWEKAATATTNPRVHVALMRFAPVLKKNEGMLKKLMPAYNLGLGGTLGTGNQPFSWIHLQDLIQGILFLIHHPDITGAVNFCAPECVTQKTFAQTLAKSMHRPAFMKTPAWLLKPIFGQMANELLLSGQNVYPERLTKARFEFSYPDLASALSAD